jgi:hypothetical protein
MVEDEEVGTKQSSTAKSMERKVWKQKRRGKKRYGEGRGESG